jgi:serine phosphatase RsbU (regulator of sigma subunit)
LLCTRLAREAGDALRVRRLFSRHGARRLLAALSVAGVLGGSIGACRLAAQEAGRVPTVQPAPVEQQAAGAQPDRELTARQLARVALGFVMASAGAAALVIAALYRGASVMTLVAFGLFALSYGSLILFQIPLLRALVGVSSAALGFVIYDVSYAVPALGMLYAEQIRGRGWMSIVRRSWQVGLPLAAVLAVYDLITGQAGASFLVYQVYLVAALLILLPHVILFQHRDRVERLVRAIGTGLLAVTLLVDVLSRMFSWRGGFDTYGIACFVLAQGVVTARRFFADQRELAAVEHELETARTIQTAILPREVPRIDALRIAVRYLPARTVAGDLYDFQPVDAGRLGVLIADVAGHGVSAALIASMTTVAFASQKPHAADTARTLAEMNRVLCGHFESRYVTAAYVFFETSRRTLRYSRAGHPPPLLWRAASQRIDQLTDGSIVLGLLEHAAYQSTEVPFEPGDRLILYTDGLLEAQNQAGEWFGDAELTRAIREYGATDAEAFCSALLAHLARWCGAAGSAAAELRFKDDVTIIVVDAR